jgi:epoxyqueuosine reductase QueG
MMEQRKLREVSFTSYIIYFRKKKRKKNDMKYKKEFKNSKMIELGQRSRWKRTLKFKMSIMGKRGKRDCIKRWKRNLYMMSKCLS